MFTNQYEEMSSKAKALADYFFVWHNAKGHVDGIELDVLVNGDILNGAGQYSG